MSAALALPETTHLVLALTRYGACEDAEMRPRTGLERVLAAPSVDLAVLDGAPLPDRGPRLHAAILAARRPGTHDPTVDADLFRLPASQCLRLVGPPGSLRPATRAILDGLAPYRLAPDRPSADARAQAALNHDADLSLARAMLTARQRLTAAAIHRQQSLAQSNAYWHRLAPIFAAAQDQITLAWLDGGHPPRDIASPGNGFVVFDPDADEPVRHLSADAAQDRAALAELCAALSDEARRGTFLLVPTQGPAASPGVRALDATVDAAHTAMRDGHRGYAAARRRFEALDAWIAATLDSVVAFADRQLGPGYRPVETAMRALRLDFVNEAGTCPILGPNTPIGDHTGYLLLMAEARPAEAVRALRDPRQWPNLLDTLAAHPILQRVAEAVQARGGKAHLEISGSTDIRAARRPGLLAETRFDALRTGEQSSITVPLAPGVDSPFAALRPGQILRVNARRPDAIAAEAGADEAVNEQVDLMVTGFPKRLTRARLNALQIERLAHREGLTASAYAALLERQDGGIVIGVKVVAERRITAARHREIQRQRARERQIVKQIVRQMAIGRERGR